MQLKIVLPTKVLLDEETGKINAESGDGAFCLLPEHADGVTALVSGILSFWNDREKEVFVAIDEGVLIKQGNHVLVATGRAVRGTNLDTLYETVEAQLQKLEEREAMTRSALSKLEASFIRASNQIGGDSREP